MIYRHDEDLAPPAQGLDTTRLWVSDQQWLAILERVQRGQPIPEADADDCRRMFPREVYECRCMLRLSGVAGTYIVRTRDISGGGLCFVHGLPLRPSTRCTIALQAEDGPGRILSAVVAWCKEIEFFDPDVEAYEIGVKFDTTIETRGIVGGGGAA